MVRMEFTKPKTRSTKGHQKAHPFGGIRSLEMLQDMAATDLCPKCRRKNPTHLGNGRFYCRDCGHEWIRFSPNQKTMKKEKLRYIYEIFDVGGSGKYGPCEVCGRPTKRTFHQIRKREYLRPDGSIDITCIGDLFGHKSCLIARRKKNNYNV